MATTSEDIRAQLREIDHVVAEHLAEINRLGHVATGLRSALQLSERNEAANRHTERSALERFTADTNRKPHAELFPDRKRNDMTALGTTTSGSAVLSAGKVSQAE